MERIDFSASVFSPFTEEEAKEILNYIRTNKINNIEVYLGVERFKIVYYGIRTYKYGKNAKKSVLSKINYTVINNI